SSPPRSPLRSECPGIRSSLTRRSRASSVAASLAGQSRGRGEMRFKLGAVLAAAAFVVLVSTAQGATFTHLQPGAHAADLRERVPVNVVFVGFEPNQVPASTFLAGLVNHARPIVWSRLFYGNLEELGLDYRYDYRLTYTSTAWESQFFGALKGLAKPADRTDFQ